ncbi:sulfurtransferase TusA family protein [Psychrobacter sp.]|uniref:sulfurtransferase TusA family protein n=1 Tax=Psychrobacter sp. TaxID=56811 RepID=UPI0025E635A3|nr:sulfurtransferase TusA family protein [Psychrobacter sp.]
MIQINLQQSEQNVLLRSYLDAFNPSDLEVLKSLDPELSVTTLVDGRGLACPMPLLKTKVALRSIQPLQSVYVLATDPNSQADLAAFCQQAGLQLTFSTTTTNESTDSLEKLDTIFHAIITKTHGN